VVRGAVGISLRGRFNRNDLMDKFVFHHPTKVIFGRQGLTRLGRECARLGTRALLLYGGQHLQAGEGYQQVCRSLAAAGVDWLELGGIRPNPRLAQVRRGIGLAQEHNVQVVVAVGGGSVMDSAKAVAAGACVNHDIWLFFRGKKSIRRALPVICVPTAAGSGSEYNHGMVLTNELTRQKIGIGNRHLLPAVAIMDPELSCTVPWRQTLNGAVDTLSHLLEFFGSGSPPGSQAYRPAAHAGAIPNSDCGPPAGSPAAVSSALQDRLAIGLIKTIMASCARLKADSVDYQGRADMLWASALALGGLNNAGRGRVTMPAHLLAHALGGRYDLAHGELLAVILPAWLQFTARRDPSRITAWTRPVFTAGPTRSPEPGPAELKLEAEQGLQALRQWLRRMGAPQNLAEIKIPTGKVALAELVEHTLPQARLWRLPYGRKELLEILNYAQGEGNSPAGP
jgi:alcohol dehydrogenase YqhD (iron-dependent ADH family)